MPGQAAGTYGGQHPYPMEPAHQYQPPNQDAYAGGLNYQEKSMTSGQQSISQMYQQQRRAMDQYDGG
jgi:hypothetical protein